MDRSRFVRALYRRLWLPLYRRRVMRRVRHEREFSLAGLRLRVPPGVFHPGLYFSTPIFLEFLQNTDFQGKTVLDVGTGSGILALFAARKGARATALDLSPLAVETAGHNAAVNGLSLELLPGDLFDALPAGRRFDRLLVNPPYYPRTPRNMAEHAFFAGENLDYFRRFFGRLGAVLQPGAKTWLILSEDCAWTDIVALARASGFEPKVVFERKKWGERFFVAELGAPVS